MNGLVLIRASPLCFGPDRARPLIAAGVAPFYSGRNPYRSTGIPLCPAGLHLTPNAPRDWPDKLGAVENGCAFFVGRAYVHFPGTGCLGP